jgi:transcriptional regulator with XRE-family HTH domain
MAIRKRRKDSGYSQESFADAVGVHRTYMGSVERGERNISLRNLGLIARTLNITLSRLIQDAEEASTPSSPARHVPRPGKK